jgi:hypothetical protein
LQPDALSGVVHSDASAFSVAVQRAFSRVPESAYCGARIFNGQLLVFFFLLLL